MSKLAIFGGRPVLAEPLPHYNSVGQEELEAVTNVMKSGCLSGFYGSWGDEFFGGPMVRAFEAAWCERFSVNHAVTVNSATSGLIAALGAVGISPGDEVIIPPYTMSATAMAPLVYGGIPVFADIDSETFCLDVAAVRQAITPRTKAIIAVNLFGQAAPLADLLSLAQEHGLWLIEDNAQGPLASEYGRYCGTIGHIGIFSLNYHKHIHTGEGSVCVTNNAELAQRLQMIRNHAENIVEPLGLTNLTNMVGFNFRLTELSAAVGLEQLKKIEYHVGRREQLAAQLTEALTGLEGLTLPYIRPNCRHVFYLWALRFDAATVGVTREQFSRALTAEGFPHFLGYIRPLYLLPVFQQRIAIGAHGYPFNLTERQYEKGLCPVAERMHYQELICFEVCLHEVDAASLSLLIEAFQKVYTHRAELAEIESN